MPRIDTLAALAIRHDVPLERIDAEQWDAIAAAQPFSTHAFLSALHESGCASRATGWTPRFVTAWRGDSLQGALPLYAKTHSYGEYVFDWGWADAYRRYGRRYYPKLVCAIPFTPVSGPRLFANDDSVKEALRAAAAELVSRHEASSLHILFPDERDTALCVSAGMTIRTGMQFHWTNSGYRDFDDFLSRFSHDKRKKVKQDRRRVRDAGITFTRKTSSDISAADWSFFYGCYESTYRAHHSTPYLTPAFFKRIGETLGKHILMVIGAREGRRICAALDVFDAESLWGRYWGSIDYVPGLHFEACYYQAIDFCVERRITSFEGGAQGLHKLARGLAPVVTHSAHYIGEPAFAEAIDDYCARERIDISHTVDELAHASPFRRTLPMNDK